MQFEWRLLRLLDGCTERKSKEHDRRVQRKEAEEEDGMGLRA